MVLIDLISSDVASSIAGRGKCSFSITPCAVAFVFYVYACEHSDILEPALLIHFPVMFCFKILMFTNFTTLFSWLILHILS